MDMMFQLAAAVVTGGDALAREASTFDWWMLGIYMFLALGVSFLCSLLEAAILSVPQAHVMVLAETGSASGRMLKHMKERIDRPLAAILSLNTIAHTVGAAGVGAQVLIIFGNEWVAIASAIVTLLILVLSEIIPKSLGATHAKALAGFTAYTTQLLIWSLYPLVVMLEVISRALGSGHRTAVTRDEIRIIAELGRHGGALAEKEARVIDNLLRLREVRVQDIMTPRAVAFMLPADTTVGQTLAAHPELRFSRIPIYGESIDDIIGLVRRQAILHAARDGDDARSLRELVRPVKHVPITTSVGDTLNMCIHEQEHLLVAVDEFGGTAGVVTLEDCVETLLGVEIVDETDTVDDMRRLARERMDKRRQRHSLDADAERAADEPSDTEPA